MKELLVGNPELLEQFVVENTDLDTLEKWMQMRAKSLGQLIKPPRAKNKLSSWKVLNSASMYYNFKGCIRAGFERIFQQFHLISMSKKKTQKHE